MDNIKRMDERQAALHDHFPSTHYLHKQENVMRLMDHILSSQPIKICRALFRNRSSSIPAYHLVFDGVRSEL